VDSGSEPPVPPLDPARRRLAAVEPAGNDGWLGVELRPTGPHEPGVLIKSVIPGSPAALAGIRGGDIVLSVDAQAVLSPDALIRWVGERAAGTRARFGILRQKRTRILAVELAGRPSDDDLWRMLYVGLPAPALDGLEAVQGRIPRGSADLRGHVTVVEFWAAWCPACRFLVPLLNRWHRRFSGDGLRVLAVTTDPPATAKLAAMQLEMEYDVASDSSTRTTRAYRGQALPTLFVIDSRGVVRDVVVGYSAERLLELDSLLETLSQQRGSSDDAH
jgi:thiol-disulfide isomerase/thioredoxin